MPSTHLSLHYHVVFSTKDRRSYIATAWRDRLHEYLGGIIRECGAVPEAIGGVEDHVHLLMGLRATHALANVMRSIKCNSSRWVHEETRLQGFAWQEGYGAFTVGVTQLEGVKHYIAHQEEYIEFLERSGMEFDPRYLW